MCRTWSNTGMRSGISCIGATLLGARATHCELRTPRRHLHMLLLSTHGAVDTSRRRAPGEGLWGRPPGALIGNVGKMPPDVQHGSVGPNRCRRRRSPSQSWIQRLGATERHRNKRWVGPAGAAVMARQAEIAIHLPPGPASGPARRDDPRKDCQSCGLNFGPDSGPDSGAAWRAQNPPAKR